MALPFEQVDKITNKKGNDLDAKIIALGKFKIMRE
jgi:hypothetical protein